MSEIQLYCGDCLEIMPTISDKSIDCIICDLPYGTTACAWDVVIPFDKLWAEYNRVIKDNGAIILFGVEPFSSMLRMSNIKGFKYDMVWHKSKSGSAFTAKYRPVAKHEMISVFSKGGGKTKYNPQMVEGTPYKRELRPKLNGEKNNHKLGMTAGTVFENKDGLRYPETVLEFQQKWRRQDQVHPTQKPVDLIAWLVRSYSDVGDTILDNCMGSGTTGVACKRECRNFIGIEKEEKYYKIAKERIEAEFEFIVMAEDNEVCNETT